MKKRLCQSLCILSLSLLLFLYTEMSSLSVSANDTKLYKNTPYTVNMIQPVLDCIALNRARMQQYMYVRFPKVPELDWENPDEIDPSKALWKFRWLSHDWCFVVMFDMQQNKMSAMYSYEVPVYDETETN